MSEPVGVKDSPVDQPAMQHPSAAQSGATPKAPNNSHSVSLRDFLIAHALEGILASGRETLSSDPNRTASLAISYADAILKQRG